MYKEKLNNLKMREIDDKELMKTNGGAVGAGIVVAVVAIAVVGFVVGVYNGYKDAEAKAK